MTAQLLAGQPVADAVLDDVQQRVTRQRSMGRRPGLGTILVGDDPASAGYIRKKHEACAEVGLESVHIGLGDDASQADLHAAIRDMNEAEEVSGFIVQNPPGHLDFGEAMAHVDPAKDADGLHPTNLGRLVLGQPGPVPCTPAGIEHMLAFYGIPIEGRAVVVLGRGPTLGRPLALLLSQKRATANAAVTVVHTGVPDWDHYTRQAEVLVAAAGVPGIVRPEHVRPGAVVVSGGLQYEGRRVLPDVDESVAELASWITPRVGGVGPLTVAFLLRNAIAACERRHAG